jgi:hypothetical protein
MIRHQIIRKGKAPKFFSLAEMILGKAMIDPPVPDQFLYSEAMREVRRERAERDRQAAMKILSKRFSQYKIGETFYPFTLYRKTENERGFGSKLGEEFIAMIAKDGYVKIESLGRKNLCTKIREMDNAE